MLHKLMQLLLCATAISNLAVNALPAGGGGSTSDAPPALPMVEHPASKAYWGALKVPDTSPPRNWLPPPRAAARTGSSPTRKKPPAAATETYARNTTTAKTGEG